jgi:hypothetical protein
MLRIRPFIARFAFVIVAASSQSGIAFAAEQSRVFERVLPMDIKEPKYFLSVAVSAGDIFIGYIRDDRLTIYAYGKDASGKYLPAEYFKNKLVIEQKGSHVSVRESADIGSLLSSTYSVYYRIDIPYRTEVESTVSGTGNQTLMGAYGPVTLVSGTGDIDAEYVRFAAIHASTGKGNVSCIRDLEVDAETGNGNITLMEDRNSKALVKSGHGKIEIGGARGTVDGSTDTGSIHIRAVPWDDWQLKSGSGLIRLELPPKQKFEIDASSDSGEIDVERDDMQKPEGDVHNLHEQVNGGGKHIAAHSIKGGISIE